MIPSGTPSMMVMGIFCRLKLLIAMHCSPDMLARMPRLTSAASRTLNVTLFSEMVEDFGCMAAYANAVVESSEVSGKELPRVATR